MMLAMLGRGQEPRLTRSGGDVEEGTESEQGLWALVPVSLAQLTTLKLQGRRHLT